MVINDEIGADLVLNRQEPTSWTQYGLGEVL